MPELPTVNTNYRSVQTDDPGAALSFNRSSAQNVASSVPNTSQQLIELLTKAQHGYQQTQSQFQNTERRAVREQATVASQTPSDLIGAPPSLQRFVRSANASVYEPTIGGARAAISDAGDALARLGQMRQDEEQKVMQYKAEKRANLELIIGGGTSSELLGLLAESPELFKEVGFDLKTVAAFARSKKVAEDRETALFRKQMAPAGGGGDSGFNPNKLLTISEAKDLGLPYGTTHGEAVNNAGGQFDTAQTEKLKDKIKLVDDLKKHPGLNSRVGPNWFSRKAWQVKDAFGQGQAFAGSVQKLIGKETIDELVNLKERGGTLGALSDKERELLEQSASEIGSWAIKDDNGFNTGEYDIDQKTFKTALDNISRLARNAMERHTGMPYSVQPTLGEEAATTFTSPAGNSYQLPY